MGVPEALSGFDVAASTVVGDCNVGDGFVRSLIVVVVDVSTPFRFMDISVISGIVKSIGLWASHSV